MNKAGIVSWVFSMLAVLFAAVVMTVLTDRTAQAERHKHSLWLQQIGRGEKGECADGENDGR